MERRGFIKSLAAITGMAAVPTGAVFATQASVATATTAVRANLYTWSAMIARTQGACSPKILMSTLNIEAAQANFLFNRLITNNVVGVSGTTLANKARAIVKGNTNEHLSLHIDDNKVTDDDICDSEVEETGEIDALNPETQAQA